MRCEQIRDLLSPYIDRMTNEKEKEAVEAHIFECEECRRELEELETFCAALKKLDSPSIPGDFSQDLHKRLIKENGGIFVKRLRKPGKTGWIAAGVAGIALTAGIYVSSLLPPLGQIALFQDKEKVEPQKPSMAVEDILERIKGSNYDNEMIIDTPVNVAENENTESQVSTNNMDNKENESPGLTVENGDTGTAPENSTETESVVADVFSTRVKVNDIEESITRLIEIADNNKAVYTLMPNGTTAQASSDLKAKELVLKLDSSNLEAVLTELQKIGKISEPEYEKLVLTQQLGEVDRHINFLEQQLETINSNEEISEAEQAKFEELSSELNNWQKQKASLEKTINGVTLKIYIVEEIPAQ